MSNGMNSEKAILWAEKWTPIVIDVEGVEHPPRYEVSNFGRLRSFQNNEKGEIILDCRKVNLSIDTFINWWPKLLLKSQVSTTNL
jgi:NUMOD4 motif